ncbi:MAG TPA: hypothetical protein VLI90_08065 [Tepidisphaeraceae bacterium]|nr:hypothetical protein [Tepidisphaeraceae bacterium]
MGFFDRLLGKKAVQPIDPDAPFMEHPTGDFKSAVDAMADAIQRLRALPQWDEWINFCGQGVGHDEDSDHLAEIRVRRDELSVDEPVDTESVIRKAGVPPSALVAAGGNFSIAAATPAEAARILDAIFRLCLGIRPHADEGDDYAVGAEW